MNMDDWEDESEDQTQADQKIMQVNDDCKVTGEFRTFTSRCDHPH